MSDNLLSALQQARKSYPTPMTDAQRGALLNEVAYAAGDGWGLLDKPSGAHVPQPTTGRLIAGDILFNRITGHHYDVLRDGEGAAEPEWQDDGPMDLGRWVAPVAPTPAPAPPPVPHTSPPIADAAALKAIQSQLSQVNAKLDVLLQKPAPPVPNYVGKLFGIAVVLHPDN